jgi:hypothetical protein
MNAFGDEPGRLYTTLARSSEGPWQAVTPERITDALLMNHRPTAVLHWAQPGWQGTAMFPVGGTPIPIPLANEQPVQQPVEMPAQVHRLNLATGRKKLC